MAYFAKLDASNTVIDVIAVNNSDISFLPFPESEPVGRTFLRSIFPEVPETAWVQTSYNNNFRVRYAVIGANFYPDSPATPYGGFAPLCGCSSLVFDLQTCDWVPPVPYPTDGKSYSWDCAEAKWVEYYVVVGEPTPGFTAIG